MASLGVLAPSSAAASVPMAQPVAASPGAAKRTIDITVGVVSLIVCIPIFIVCAIVIRLASGGPILFTQTRVGKDGVLFKMYKFRTMRNNCERNGAVWASDNDPRVVPACRWMRFSHIDELPQLINVIKGQMALVGPRPEREEIMGDLEQLYPNVRERLEVRPGITGLAQIRWGYDTTAGRFHRKLQADLEYIRNRDWRLDAKIVLRTFPKFFDRSAK